MTLVDDAFSGLKTNLEITSAEQALAQSRHVLIRDHVRTRWKLTADFLTGSYDRHTKTKKLKDVDLFVVIDPDGGQRHLANGTGTAAVDALAEVLSTRWHDVTTDDTVVTVSYVGEDVASYEIAPAFATKDGYRIPNGTGWMETNPNKHAEMVTAKNKACGGKFVPLVKMIKGMNREAGELISPSFLIEVMALELVETPLGRYQDEVRFFLASATDAALKSWPDPAGLGPDVNGSTQSWERTAHQNAFRSWLAVAEEAILLENEGQERAAVSKWKALFGSRMPG
ncbi:hypothetical protein KM427_01580 [Nocardioides sp. LMS-CY]|uniref:CBASS oligonucleotide cyclase n=1 Tax=Nocardioides sp. (strain LMS-CY) TaxID=2840457 RepID=UPI001BFFECF2|nr:CBASS oligonucleotide cyclase [Nocardioides sp. LMS-CY]QWF22468.1 hypothetical protein KM427_01580 [Nocardioides sp. LMS-CY]